VIIRLKNLPGWVKGIKINADENSDIELIWDSFVQLEKDILEISCYFYFEL
jgi:hypothetical protein